VQERPGTDAARAIHDAAERIRANVARVIVGAEETVDLVLVAVLAGGHVLLEDVPGTGKTTMARAFARSIGGEFRRIQFTPDLMPTDVLGLNYYSQRSGEFEFRPGPVFSHIVIGDEINRASPKTQSALLEAMQERRVTVMGTAHPLPDPFFVIATQNPIELEGTYPLPEAQLDRFLFKLDVPRAGTAVLERIILDRGIGEEPAVECVLTGEELAAFATLARQLHLPPSVANYIARLVDATHPGCSPAAQSVRFGASPRAALALAAASRARALLEGRLNAGFEDVAAVALPVLGHRILLDYSARISGQTPGSLVGQLLEAVPRQEHETPRLLKTQTA